MVEKKICPKCKECQPVENFRLCSNGKILRRATYCNPCAVEITKEHRRQKALMRSDIKVPDLEGERWIDFDIDGFGGNYMVSNCSRIKSKYRKVKSGNKEISVFEKILKTSNLKGYKSVEITNETGDSKKFLVHKIIAIAFIPNPDNKPCINHINGVKSDNRIENLEWCTHSENTMHAWRDIKTMKPYLDGEKKVKQITPNGEVVKVWESASKAARGLRLSQGNICAVARGERAICGNFKWEYVN